MSHPITSEHADASGLSIPESAANPAERRHNVNPEAIRAARAVLRGRFPLPGTNTEIDQSDIQADWTYSFFEPEKDVASLSAPEARTALAHGLNLTLKEEMALHSAEPDQLGVELSLRVYELAASEALEVLMKYSQDNPYRSSRLRARVCAAIREELAALVSDWDALNGGAR